MKPVLSLPLPGLPRWLVAILLALLLSVASACRVNPATGQSQFNVLSENEEIQIGEEHAPVFLEEYGGPIPSERVQRYVTELGMDLAAVSERPDLPWEFHTIDSGVINAFALPGGKVFVSRGLIAQMQNEAQLASVLGHEIGHVTAQHIGQQMSRAAAAQLGLGVLGAAVSEEQWGQLLGIGAELSTGVYLLSFGREQENEADELGLRYMDRLDYNPVAALDVMEILRGAGASGGIEWLSTHPAPDTRLRRIQEVIQREYPEYEDTSRYRLGQDNFRENVLDELADLPAPEHGAQQQQGMGRPPVYVQGHGHGACLTCGGH